MTAPTPTASANWLESFFHETYDLVYLDPLVCSLLSRDTWILRHLVADSDRRAVDNLLHDIRHVLQLQPSKHKAAAFFDKGAPGSKVRLDRQLQHELSKTIAKCAESIDKRHYNSVSELLGDHSLAEIADQPARKALVVVDGGFARRSACSPALQRLIDVPYLGLPEQGKRSVEAVLADVPTLFTKLADPVLGLVVHSDGFYKWLESAFVKAEWYPYARVVGLYARSARGSAVVNVLAILVRQYPPLSQVLAAPDPASHGSRGQTLTERLSDIDRHILSSEIKTLSALSAAPAPIYDKDEVFLYPVCFLKLCCQLHDVGWKTLEDSAPYTAAVLKSYLAQLGVLKKRLEHLKMESRLSKMPVEPETLLPETPEWRMPPSLVVS